MTLARTQPLGGLGEVFVLTVADSTLVESLVERWSGTLGVVYAQPNHRYRLDRAAADLSFEGSLDSLAHLVAMGVPEAWQVTRGAPSVRVGVVDTGLWFEHPAFAGQIAINPGEDLNGNGILDPEDFNGIDDDGNGYVDDVAGYDFVDRGLVLFEGDYRVRDGDPGEDPTPGAGRGHGTAVSGALVAQFQGAAGVWGMAPGVRIVPLRAFGADGIGEDDDIAAAIVYAAEAGLDVLNLSFGDVYRSPLMHDAITYAVSRGVTVVASGGNDGMVQPHYPSDYPEVISVAWLTSDGQQRSGRASRGPGIDIGAPGSQIYTTRFVPSSDGNVERLYGRESGSSMAAPFVSGVAALLRSLDPSLSPASIREILTATAQDIEAPGWDEDSGAGLVRADRAVRLALPARLELLSPVMDAGVSAPAVPIVATALDPAFRALHVEVAAGFEEPFQWQPIAPARTSPVLRDAVAVWDAAAFDEGIYTLRLRLERTDGAGVEARARVTVDRSPPVFVVRDVRVGFAGGAYAVIADVETDDRTAVAMHVGSDAVRSDRVARRHGLVWRDERRAGGAFTVRIEATNVAGITASFETSVLVPAWQPDPARFELERLAIPAGYLLPEATDFDGDGWLEVVVNQAPEGAVGDTLAFWEATPAGFARRQALIATVIPRSAGDTDGDGRGEVLGQVHAATILIEADSVGGFPAVLAFVDSTGLSNPSSPQALFGAVLADLDGDGQGEIIGHNGQQIRVLERRGAQFAEVARLGNPTPPDSMFSEPDFRVADLNGNGRPELIAPDADGDVIAYEAVGDDTYALAWQISTGYESLRSTLAIGDLDGDGRDELLTFTQNRTGTRSDREQEPAVSTYRLWHFGSGTPDSMATLTAYGAGYAFAGATMADLDGDGRDELILAHPPDLFVFSWSGEDFRLRFHAGDDGQTFPTVVRSPALTPGDFDGDGQAEVLASFTDGFVHRLRYRDALAPDAPRWIAAFAVNDSTVHLRWNAAADSVQVFAGPPAGDLAPLATTDADSLVLAQREQAVYVLRAWRNGQASAFSDPRSVAPHPQGQVVALRRPERDVLEVETDVSLAAPDVSAIRAGGRVPLSALRVNARVARFRFETLQTGEEVWIGALHDTSGTPVQVTRRSVPALERPAATLFIAEATVVEGNAVRIRFSAPLDPASLGLHAFRIEPAGSVEAVTLDEDDAAVVVLRIAGVALGPTGLGVTIRAAGIRSAAGDELAAEGAAILLAEPAADLAAAFVYPNPVRLDRHDALTLGGVPSEVEAVVLTVDGVVVRRLSTDASRGGLRWDLRDEGGASVPSGVYLVRLTAPGSAPVLLKAAIIR